MATINMHIKFCASFHHMLVQTGVMVRAWLSLVLTSVTLNFDFQPFSFAWNSWDCEVANLKEAIIVAVYLVYKSRPNNIWAFKLNFTLKGRVTEPP